MHGVGRRIGHRMDYRVQLPVMLLELRVECIDLSVAGDIALEGLRAGKGSYQVMRLSLHALVLIGDCQPGAGGAQALGNGPGAAAFVGNAKNDCVLSLHAQHSVVPQRSVTAQDIRNCHRMGVTRAIRPEIGTELSLNRVVSGSPFTKNQWTFNVWGSSMLAKLVRALPGVRTGSKSKLINRT